MKVHVVIGANYGDEGKGLVSGCLAREASLLNERVLTVFYNGTSQRAHTFEGEVHRCMAAGTSYGSDTFYYKQFVIDPISVFIMQAEPIIDGDCRVILPCDVIQNRKLEKMRGQERHGSCGFGLFEAVKRSKNPEYDLRVSDLVGPLYLLREKLNKIEEHYGMFQDEIYNLHNLLLARNYILMKCNVKSFEETAKDYDRIIFEGGQGLMLDQKNHSCFPHLTPSCPGNDYIWKDISKLTFEPELFYVSRSYETRHGAGPMETECGKEAINPEIIDTTNEPNEFQGSLRFGRLNLEKMYSRILHDANSFYLNPVKNLVFTQLNYTNGKLETTKGQKDIYLPNDFNHIFVSDQKDKIELLI